MQIGLFRALALTLAISILAGCAAPPVPSLPATQQEPTSHGLIDAPAGEHLDFSGKLNASATGAVKLMRVVTKAHRLQPSKEWMPTIIFCLKQEQTGASYCLNTYATSDGTRLVAKLVYKESDSGDVVSTRLPFDLAPFDSHYLDIAFVENRLLMVIDDTEFFDHPLPAVIDGYWFSCSSIVCSVEVEYPYHPRTNGG